MGFASVAACFFDVSIQAGDLSSRVTALSCGDLEITEKVKQQKDANNLYSSSGKKIIPHLCLLTYSSKQWIPSTYCLRRKN